MDQKVSSTVSMRSNRTGFPKLGGVPLGEVQTESREECFSYTITINPFCERFVVLFLLFSCIYFGV